MDRGIRLIAGGGVLVAALLAGLKLAARTEAAPAKRDIVVAEVGKNRIYLTELNEATAPYKYRLEQQGYDFGSVQGRFQYQQLQTKGDVKNPLITQSHREHKENQNKNPALSAGLLPLCVSV